MGSVAQVVKGCVHKDFGICEPNLLCTQLHPSYHDKLMIMKRNYREGDARREGSSEVNVKDQNMQDEHDVE